MKPIHKYALHGNLEQLKHELNSGISVSEPESEYQMTPLHLANIKRQVAVVKLLLEYGADIYALDADGSTPLDFATSFLKQANDPEQIKNSLEIIRLILNKEVELRLQGKYIGKPLLKNIKNKFNLTPTDHLNSKPDLKRSFIELTKKAEDELARGRPLEAANSTSKMVSGLRNRKQDASSSIRISSQNLEDSQNKDPNSPIIAKSSWFPSIIQAVFKVQSTPEEQEALLKHEGKRPQK
jgi:hypothetical protein